MIHRLRRRFIAIAMTSVTLVMCLMALSMNVFNFLSTDGALSDTLRVIYENQGSIPPPPEGGPDGPPGGRFTQETPYSTRYFILAYRGDGTLELADMRHIAAVTEEASQVAFPLRKGDETASLRQQIDQAVDELRESGELAQISTKYFGSDYTQE